MTIFYCYKIYPYSLLAHKTVGELVNPANFQANQDCGPRWGLNRLPSLPDQLLYSNNSGMEALLESRPPPGAVQPLSLQTWPFVESLLVGNRSDTVLRTALVQHGESPRWVDGPADVNGSASGWDGADRHTDGFRMVVGTR